MNREHVWDVVVVGGEIAGMVSSVRLCAGVTYTVGELAIDSHSRVLDGRNQPMAGLYTAGCAIGGFGGGEFAGYVGRLAKSSTMTFQAANHIARCVRRADLIN